MTLSRGLTAINYDTFRYSVIADIIYGNNLEHYDHEKDEQKERRNGGSTQEKQKVFVMRLHFRGGCMRDSRYSKFGITSSLGQVRGSNHQNVIQ